MPKEKTVQSDIGGYIANLMRENFGKGPSSVFVSITPNFISIYLRGCLTPAEKILLKQNQSQLVSKIRDLLMVEFVSEIKIGIWKLAELDVKEIYADWNFDKESGVLIATLDDKANISPVEWPEEVDQDAFIAEIIKKSIEVQKEPVPTDIHWLNDRSVLIERTGILVQIEKELIKIGFVEELKLAKRPLEYKFVRNSA
ncbi:DUF2294 domain-containing protein [Planococcus sp. YIM B11945]|uniref:DUF2294 domain-containing protein n=1 Tax=Planococcus sp. YIM B11945 TaxID=3435410 RepID=UPI003D7E7FA7